MLLPQCYRHFHRSVMQMDHSFWFTFFFAYAVTWCFLKWTSYFVGETGVGLMFCTSTRDVHTVMWNNRVWRNIEYSSLCINRHEPQLHFSSSNICLHTKCIVSNNPLFSSSAGIQMCPVASGCLGKPGLFRDCPDGFLTLQESRWFLIMPCSQLFASQPHKCFFSLLTICPVNDIPVKLGIDHKGCN